MDAISNIDNTIVKMQRNIVLFRRWLKRKKRFNDTTIDSVLERIEFVCSFARDELGLDEKILSITDGKDLERLKKRLIANEDFRAKNKAKRNLYLEAFDQYFSFLRKNARLLKNQSYGLQQPVEDIVSATITENENRSELAEILQDTKYGILLSSLDEDGIRTVEEFRQINILRYLNSKNLYDWKERLEVAKDINLMFGENQQKNIDNASSAAAGSSIKNTASLLRITSYIQQQGLSPCSIDEIAANIVQGSIKRSTIVNAIEENTKIVEIEKGKYIHRDCIVDLDQAAIDLLNILQSQFAQFNGYTNYQLLFDAARIDLSMFMNDNDFNNAENIYYLAKHLFSKEGYNGNRFVFYGNMHIWQQEPDYPKSLKGLMIHLARDAGGLITREECEAFLNKAKLKYSSVNQILQIANEHTFLQYDNGKYLLTEMLRIDEAWKMCVTDALKGLFNDAEYVIPRDIGEAWFKKLPALPMGQSWTPLLLQEVLTYFEDIGYRTISALDGQPFDTIHAAIVPADSTYQTFADVVCAYLDERMTLPQRMGAEDLRLLLREAGMLEGNELICNMHKALDDYRFAWSDENKTVYIHRGD